MMLSSSKWLSQPVYTAPLLGLLGLLASGCGITVPTDALSSRDRGRVMQLEHLLLGMGEGVAKNEAGVLAADSIAYAYQLKKRYKLVWPPLWHNTLVNVGLKERGLCYEWADDLYAHVLENRYQTFDFYLGVAEKGTLWEHNAVVVSAKGAAFEQGVVLDAWRNSGELYFAKVSEDKYKWRARSVE